MYIFHYLYIIVLDVLIVGVMYYGIFFGSSSVNIIVAIAWSLLVVGAHMIDIIVNYRGYNFNSINYHIR